MRRQLSVDQRNAVSRISGLVLVNAMIFQQILAEYDDRVLSLEAVLDTKSAHLKFIEHWKYILTDINYYPIFHVARQLLVNMSTSGGIYQAIVSLATTAQEVVGMRAAMRHDLMGRVYHRLLVERKYLGTYYTSIPAATMLLKLAMRPDAWDVKWENLSAIQKLRIGDLACGTGTLLMAAADAVTDNYVSRGARQGKKIDFDALQRILTEDVLYGYDVLASAVHLTASTLALKAPEVPFTKMNLFNLPLGGVERRMGSIEYLIDEKVGMPNDLFGAHPVATQVKAKEVKELPVAPLPELDLCVMNPPFTRSVGGNLLFGSLPEDERKKTQEDLKKLIQRKNVSASITAGLGAVFVAAAHPYIKEGGRIGLVLPKAVLSGVAWGRTRELLSKHYELEYIISSHDPLKWNFSESTSLSEVLIVARKVSPKRRDSGHRVVAVNLWRNPTTGFDARVIARTLLTESAPDLRMGQGALDIYLGREKLAEALSQSGEELHTSRGWMHICAFCQTDLLRAAHFLNSGHLWLPGFPGRNDVPLCKLEDIAVVGPDARDIHDGFVLSDAPTAYAAFWGHELGRETYLAQNVNAYLSPLPKARHSRPLRKVEDLWPLASRLLVSERMRLNTQGLVAIQVDKPALSSVWWPVALKRKLATKGREKALTVWLNSTLGLILLLTRRVETE
ncbi:MAG: hypothetical protein AB1744_06955, partial [Candidatus Zixiibacteriota bacterium]